MNKVELELPERSSSATEGGSWKSLRMGILEARYGSQSEGD
jgi:hypothetical protein